MPSVFSDGMVLQRDTKVPIWGWDVPGTQVRVRFAGQEKPGTAGADGKWTVLLDPLRPGPSSAEMTIVGSETRHIRDVLVGEVWFCSGQSNMDAYASTLEPAERGTKDYPDVHFFVAKREAAAAPADDAPGSWAAHGPADPGACSAIGYLFARDLHERLKVPVGIVQATWGDTRAENWISLDALQAEPALAAYVEQWERDKQGVVGAQAYQDAYGAWSANKQGPEPIRPQKVPTALYNSMIHPLIPYGLRGILWYQGESNGWAGIDYRVNFPTLIKSWRKEWGNENLPFLFVQLPGYGKVDETPPNVSPWSLTREAQAMAVSSLPAVEMAVTIDIGDEQIHPRNKPEVARRLMLVARAKVYGEKVVYSGPRFAKAETKGRKVTVGFEYADGGLKTQDGGKVKGFALAGADRKWHWADAVIEKDKVVVSSSEVEAPTAVRYAWAHRPECNLANASGLPAAPFRTDDW